MRDISVPGLYSGTSNVVLPFPNKSYFPVEYQDKSRLTFYASLFNTVEINSSFYKVPMGSTVAKWADAVPDDFKFTFKLWQGITHNKGLVFDPESVESFVHIISHVDLKKGCLLIQFPPKIMADKIREVERLLYTVKDANSLYNWRIAFEFRNRSWYNEEVFDLLKQHDMGIVLHDMPLSAPPMTTNGNFIYLRFHGPNGNYKGSYTEAFLYEYAQYIKEWIANGKEIYVYFNNTMGDAVKNLVTLNQFLL